MLKSHQRACRASVSFFGPHLGARAPDPKARPQPKWYEVAGRVIKRGR